jgi:hypothetical protein
MMPLYPPYPFEELAREHLGAHARKHNAQRAVDPDGTLDRADALQPDPVFMGLRRIANSGPIGALMNRINRWIEAREDRRYGQTIEDALRLGTPERLAQTGSDGESGVDRGERIAA